MRNITALFFILVLSLSPVNALWSKPSCDIEAEPLINVVSAPEKYKGRKLVLDGYFFSYSTLALDYKKAYRSSKDFVSIVLSRPDFPEIPLVEMKLAVPIKMFKENEDLQGIDHGDLIRLEAKVFEVALGEPWLEVQSIKVKEKAKSDEDDE